MGNTGTPQEPKAKGGWNGPPEKRHTGGKKGARRPSRLLRDLRAVYEQPKEMDRTPGQRALRKLFDESPEQFIRQLAAAEREFRAQGRTAGSQKQGARPVEPTGRRDEGHERSELLIQQLLEQLDESGKVGSRVSGVWGSLSDEDQRTILGIIDRAPTGTRPNPPGTHL
jgi:hypothetical protein